MPRINALPSDSAPDPADMVPMIDVDADRTESVTLANLAGSTAFTSRYQPVDADLTTLAAGSLPTNLTTSIDTRYDPRYKTPSLAPMARANKITQDKTIMRVGLVGHSIASFSYSLPALGARLQTEYGRADHLFQAAGVLGGSWTAAFQGWEKQPYGGRSYNRLRGKAASSSNLTFDLYGDTITMWFSVETDAEACNIEIDGEVVGTTPAAGTQQYAVKQTYDGLTLGAHTLEIVKPAGAGYVYLEGYEAEVSTTPGVAFYNWTLGGASLGSSTALRTPISPQATGIAISGNVGIDGYFANDDIDLYVVMHDVNDAGRGSSEYTSNFLPMFNRMIEQTRDRAVPLVLVSSMAGHYALEAANADQFAVFAAIRSLYRTTALTESHVTHVDWDGATRLDDIEVYQQKYYSNVTDLNIVAGTYSGDFIHPDATMYASLQHEFAKTFAIAPGDAKTTEILDRERLQLRTQKPLPFLRPQTRDVYQLISSNSACTLNRATSTFTTTNAHGLSVGDKLIYPLGISATNFTYAPHFVLTVPSSTTFTTSLTSGGSQWTTGDSGSVTVTTVLRVAPHQFQGPAEVGLAPRWYAAAGQEQGFDDVAVWFDSDAHSGDGGAALGDIRALIDSAPDGTDEFGKYRLWATNYNFTIRPGLSFTTGQVAYLLVRYSGSLSVWPETVNDIVNMDGDVLPTPSTGLKRMTFPVVTIGDPPITAIAPIKATASSTTFVTLATGTKRVYDIAVSPSPTWPGVYTA